MSKVSLMHYPPQGSFLGRRVVVCFNYDTSETFAGEIVRDDTEEPGFLIIKLDTGQYVMSTECQYSLVPKHVTEGD
jgi:hypothetical protein